MAQNNGNRPKLEVSENPIQVKLLRDVFKGQNTRGAYYLYVVQGPDGKEYSWFAPVEAHEVIQNASLKVGSEILVSRGVNGKRNKVEVSILGRAPEASKQDDFKALLADTIKDVVQVVNESGVQFSNDSLQKLISTVFIQRTKVGL